MADDDDGKDSPPTENEKCTRPLLCAEDWQEPEGHKVIAEFHRPGLTEEDADIEADLASFEKYWKDKSGINFEGEYHKLGAPYLEEPSAWEGHRPRGAQVPPTVIVDDLAVDEGIHLEERAHIAEEPRASVIVEEVHVEERIHAPEGARPLVASAGDLVVPEKVFIEEVHIEDTQKVTSSPSGYPLEDGKGQPAVAQPSSEPKASAAPLAAATARSQEKKPADSKLEGRPKEKSNKEPLKISEIIDIATIETMSYIIIRALWGKDIHVPIKKEGVVDMELHIKGKDALINTNQLYFALPELVVWHIIYTHKGRPVLEIGRGVKNGMKLHYGGAIRLAIEFYMGNRAAIKARKIEDKNLHKHLLQEGDGHDEGP